MILHHIIKSLVSQYGERIISDLTLFNMLSDLNGLKFEDKAIKNILRQILKNFGVKILDGKSKNLPCDACLSKYENELVEDYGLRQELVHYSLECLAYGINWKNQIDSNLTISFSTRTEKLSCFNEMFNYIGMRTTQIKGNKYDNYEYKIRTYHSKEIEDSFKSAYKVLSHLEMPTSQNWESMTGIGFLCGYNNFHVLDIDKLYCLLKKDVNSAPREIEEFNLFIEKCMHILNLPSDYDWIISSGSGEGIHIIFECDPLPKYDIKTRAFKSNKIEDNLELSSLGYNYKKNVNEEFNRIELIWDGHVVLPPSNGRNYDFFNEHYLYFRNNYSYDFIYSDIPRYSPQKIQIDDLNNLLNELCGHVSIRWHKCWKIPGDNNQYKSTHLLELKKYSCSFDSMGGCNDSDDTIEWLMKCGSSDALNSIGVIYAMQGKYKDAESQFKQSNNLLSYYNLGVLILYGFIEGDKEILMDLFNNIKDSKSIPKYYIEEFERDLPEHDFYKNMPK